MAEKIESNSVLPAGTVGEVRIENNWDRIARLLPTYMAHLAATIILVAAIYVIISVFFRQISTNEKLAEYRSGAWGLLSAMVGGAMAHFFGERWKASS
jgi:hypothetical protein